MSEEKKRYTVIPRVLVFVSKENKLLMIKYSGKGTNQTAEKSERKDIYNCIGGHIEADQDVIAAAETEALEEAGVHLINPKLKGVINIRNFAGKNILNFIVTATTKDTPLLSTLEGKLKFVDPADLKTKQTFPDLVAIFETLEKLEEAQTIAGTAVYDGDFNLIDLKLRVV